VNIGLEQSMGSSIALFVDGDNISPCFSEEIMAFARQLGRLDVVRVYGGAHPASGWMEAAGFRFIHAGPGKNGADILLSIDAIEACQANEIKAFVIATSDGDFSHLAYRLRERGCEVYGLGEDKAPVLFRAACTEFSTVASKGSAMPANSTIQQRISPTKLDEKIRAMIAIHSKKGSGMRISELAPKMHSSHGVKISSHVERTWRAYLSKRPELYQLDPRGPEAKVRFVPQGFDN
jgi:NYN domain